MTFKTKRTIKKYFFVYSLLAYSLISFLIFYVYVNFKSILLAFQSIDAVGNTAFAGLENFKQFFNFLSENSNDPTLKIGLINSIKTYFIGLIGQPICLLTSFYIFKQKFFYKAYRFIVMIPQIVSSFVLCLVFFKFVENALPTVMCDIFGLETFPNLLGDPNYTYETTLFYSIWSSLAVTILLFSNAMQAIDNSIIESSRLDGCNYFQELWYIVLPLMMGTVSVGFITGIGGIFTSAGPLVAFWEFAAPPETMNIGYYFTQQVMRNKENPSVYPMLAAMGLVFTFISVPVTLLVKKLFDRFTPEV